MNNYYRIVIIDSEKENFIMEINCGKSTLKDGIYGFTREYLADGISSSTIYVENLLSERGLELKVNDIINLVSMSQDMPILYISVDYCETLPENFTWVSSNEDFKENEIYSSETADILACCHEYSLLLSQS